MRRCPFCSHKITLGGGLTAPRWVTCEGCGCILRTEYSIRSMGIFALMILIGCFLATPQEFETNAWRWERVWWLAAAGMGIILLVPLVAKLTAELRVEWEGDWVKRSADRLRQLGKVKEAKALEEQAKAKMSK